MKAAAAPLQVSVPPEPGVQRCLRLRLHPFHHSDNRGIRTRAGNTGPEALLPRFLDLVIWGHEVRR